jgi:hypothetical protein
MTNERVLVELSTAGRQHAKKIKKTVKKDLRSSKRVLHAGQWRDFGESRAKDERGLT